MVLTFGLRRTYQQFTAHVGNSSPSGIIGGGKNLLAVKKWDDGLALQDCGGIVEKPIPVATGSLNNRKIIYEFGLDFCLIPSRI